MIYDSNQLLISSAYGSTCLFVDGWGFRNFLLFDREVKKKTQEREDEDEYVSELDLWCSVITVTPFKRFYFASSTADPATIADCTRVIPYPASLPLRKVKRKGKTIIVDIPREAGEPIIWSFFEDGNMVSVHYESADFTTQEDVLNYGRNIVYPRQGEDWKEASEVVHIRESTPLLKSTPLETYVQFRQKILGAATTLASILIGVLMVAKIVSGYIADYGRIRELERENLHLGHKKEELVMKLHQIERRVGNMEFVKLYRANNMYLNLLEKLPENCEIVGETNYKVVLSFPGCVRELEERGIPYTVNPAAGQMFVSKTLSSVGR